MDTLKRARFSREQHSWETTHSLHRSTSNGFVIDRSLRRPEQAAAEGVISIERSFAGILLTPQQKTWYSLILEEIQEEFRENLRFVLEA